MKVKDLFMHDKGKQNEMKRKQKRWNEMNGKSPPYAPYVHSHHSRMDKPFEYAKHPKVW